MSDVPSRMLRETLRDALEPPLGETSPGCLDAETLAAWGDGKLSRRDRATVESHAATCARCQAMLAAMAKTAAPLPVRRWWQASMVRWLVPIAASSALAIVVWMNVPAGRQAAPVPPSEGSTRAASAPVTDTRPDGVAAPAAKAIGTLEQPADTKREQRRATETRPRSTPAGPSGALAATEQTPASSIVVQQEQASAPTAVARDASGPAAARPPAELRSEAFRALAEAVTITPAPSNAKSSAPVEIQSPNRNVRWRIVAGSTVERSTDGGATWQAQSTGAPVRLTAGVAPSATICWLVGPAGVVLASQDGLTWQRVGFPEAIDLTAIRATDGSSATATAADGRVFSTTDGGKTWR